jgi:hypothetical protein
VRAPLCRSQAGFRAAAKNLPMFRRKIQNSEKPAETLTLRLFHDTM